MAVPKIKLNNGQYMPGFGLGTYVGWKNSGSIKQAVMDAVDAGYRHFDSAYAYCSEADVGEGLKAKIQDGTVKREELFVNTKLWCMFHSPASVVKYCKKSVDTLGLGYLDSFLIHWPTAFKQPEDDTKIEAALNAEAATDTDYIETWSAMEECVRLGLTRGIGLSNFNHEQVDRILKNCTIRPIVIQIECHAYLNQKRLTKFCKDKGIVVVGYSPLGPISYKKADEAIPPVVIELAEKYKKTNGQILLRYVVELGVVPIPKSVTKDRIIENIQIFDFSLEADDIAKLDALNINRRIYTFKHATGHKYYPFHLEY